MSGLEHEDDWDTEEFQTALKIVLKYEIQSLLERLSYHGEETVLLTANMDDNCVGHLASTNAQKFVDRKDVGDLKTKFLSFLMGSDSQTAVGQMMPAAASSNIRGNVNSANQPQRTQYSGPAGGNAAAAGFRAADRDVGTLSDSETTARRLDNVQSGPVQQGKLGAKRPLEDSSVTKDKFMAQPLSPKRRKMENTGLNQAQVTGPRQKPAVPGVKSGNKPADTLPHFPASRVGGQQIQQQQKSDIKLNTTKVVSKSGFVEERLSQAEFQKILQQYKHPESEETEEDFEEEGCEDEYSEMLEEGEIPFPYMDQQPHTFPKKQTGQKQQPSSIIPATKSGNAIINANTAIAGKTGGNAIINVSTTMAAKTAGKTLDSENAKKFQQVPTSKANSVVLAAGNKSVAGVSGKKVSDDSKGVDNREDKEVDGNTKDTKKGTEQSQVKLNKDLIPDQRPKEEGEKDKTGNTPKKDGKQPVPGQPNRFSDNVDEMDTESLIKMVKEQHAKSQSDADKQIQAKLGQLSSKLSWVVEYPKDAASGEQQQQMPMPKMMYPMGMGGDYMEDEEEDDEEYDDDDFDEDELDEQDRAALAYMRKMAAEHRTVAGERSGHFEGVIGDEEFEDYDEVMEGFDQQHRAFNLAEGIGMQEYGNEEEDNQAPGFPVYRRSSSPSLDNFLLMGPSMAKCLVCNKIIRKTEIKQHNKTHEEEEGGEEGEVEDEGQEEEFGEDEEGEGVHDMGDDYDEQAEEYPEEEDMGEEEEDMEDLAEFTAEPLVAEKLVAEKIGPADLNQSKKSEKSTVCDICNKTFKSYYNMIRHQKIHDASKIISCPMCEKTFRLPSYLTKHLKKVHPDYVQQGGAGADGDGSLGAQDGGADEGMEKEKIT